MSFFVYTTYEREKLYPLTASKGKSFQSRTLMLRLEHNIKNTILSKNTTEYSKCLTKTETRWRERETQQRKKDFDMDIREV